MKGIVLLRQEEDAYGIQKPAVYSPLFCFGLDYDLIFLDHMMPEMDGVETLKVIRSLPNEKKRAVPVIALTANVTKEAQELFKKEGFDGFMPKPIDIRLLDQILTRYLRLHNR